MYLLTTQHTGMTHINTLHLAYQWIYHSPFSSHICTITGWQAPVNILNPTFNCTTISFYLTPSLVSVNGS